MKKIFGIFCFLGVVFFKSYSQNDLRIQLYEKTITDSYKLIDLFNSEVDIYLFGVSIRAKTMDSSKMLFNGNFNFDSIYSIAILAKDFQTKISDFKIKKDSNLLIFNDTLVRCQGDLNLMSADKINSNYLFMEGWFYPKFTCDYKTKKEIQVSFDGCKVYFDGFCNDNNSINKLNEAGRFGIYANKDNLPSNRNSKIKILINGCYNYPEKIVETSLKNLTQFVSPIDSLKEFRYESQIATLYSSIISLEGKLEVSSDNFRMLVRNIDTLILNNFNPIFDNCHKLLVENTKEYVKSIVKLENQLVVSKRIIDSYTRDKDKIVGSLNSTINNLMTTHRKDSILIGLFLNNVFEKNQELKSLRDSINKRNYSLDISTRISNILGSETKFLEGQWFPFLCFIINQNLEISWGITSNKKGYLIRKDNEITPIDSFVCFHNISIGQKFDNIFQQRSNSLMFINVSFGAQFLWSFRKFDYIHREVEVFNDDSKKDFNFKAGMFGIYSDGELLFNPSKKRFNMNRLYLSIGGRVNHFWYKKAYAGIWNSLDICPYFKIGYVFNFVRNGNMKNREKRNLMLEFTD